MWKSLVMICISLVSFNGAFFDLFGSNSTCSLAWTSNTSGTGSSIVMSTDGRYIGVVKGGLYTDATLSLFNRNSSSPVWNYTLEQNGYAQNGIAFEFLSMADDGSYVSVSGDRTAWFSGLGIFSRSSNVPAWILQGLGSPYKIWFNADVSGNGQLVVIDSQVQYQQFGQVQDSVSVLRNPSESPVWSYNTTYSTTEPLRGAEPPVVSYDGAYIAKTNDLGYQGSLYLFSQHDNRTIWTSKGNWLNIRMSRNGDLVAASNGTAISTFGNNSNRTIFSINLASNLFDISRDSSTLAALEKTGPNDIFHVYDLRTNRELFSLSQSSESFPSLGLSSDGSTIMFLTKGQLLVYDREGQPICSVAVPQVPVGGSIATSGDGRSVAILGSQLSYVTISSSNKTFQEFLAALLGGVIATAAVGSVLFARWRRLSARRHPPFPPIGSNPTRPTMAPGSR